MQWIHDGNDVNNVNDNIGKIIQQENQKKTLKACNFWKPARKLYDRDFPWTFQKFPEHPFKKSFPKTNISYPLPTRTCAYIRVQEILIFLKILCTCMIYHWDCWTDYFTNFVIFFIQENFFLETFYKKAILENVAKFTGKHLC